MEVKTVYGIMDIHIGARFAEVYGSISRLGVIIIWEVNRYDYFWCVDFISIFG